MVNFVKTAPNDYHFTYTYPREFSHKISRGSLEPMKTSVLKSS